MITYNQLFNTSLLSQRVHSEAIYALLHCYNKVKLSELIGMINFASISTRNYYTKCDS